MEAIIFIGIQATGKSTFYHQQFSLNHVRISLDMLKTRHREKRLLETCLDITQPFVIDNTNPTVQDRKRYIEPAKAKGFKILGYYFESKLADAIDRNRQRDSKQQIPDVGIRATYARLQLPRYAEGFDKLYYVKFQSADTFHIEGWQDEI
jgi:predicted kinase